MILRWKDAAETRDAKVAHRTKLNAVLKDFLSFGHCPLCERNHFDVLKGGACITVNITSPFTRCRVFSTRPPFLPAHSRWDALPPEMQALLMTWKEAAEIQKAKKAHQATFRRVLADLTSFSVCALCGWNHLIFFNCWRVAVACAGNGRTTDSRFASLQRHRRTYRHLTY